MKWQAKPKSNMTFGKQSNDTIDLGNVQKPKDESVNSELNKAFELIKNSDDQNKSESAPKSNDTFAALKTGNEA